MEPSIELILHKLIELLDDAENPTHHLRFPDRYKQTPKKREKQLLSTTEARFRGACQLPALSVSSVSGTDSSLSNSDFSKNDSVAPLNDICDGHPFLLGETDDLQVRVRCLHCGCLQMVLLFLRSISACHLDSRRLFSSVSSVARTATLAT